MNENVAETGGAATGAADDAAGGLMLFGDGDRRIGLALSRSVRVAAVEAVYPPAGSGEPVQAAAADGRIMAARSLSAALGIASAQRESTALILDDFCLVAPPPVDVARNARTTAVDDPTATGGRRPGRRLWWLAPDGALTPVVDIADLHPAGAPTPDRPPAPDRPTAPARPAETQPPTGIAALFDDGRTLIFPAAAVAAATVAPVALAPTRAAAGPGARRVIDGRKLLDGTGPEAQAENQAQTGAFCIVFRQGGVALTAPRLRLIFDSSPVFTRTAGAAARAGLKQAVAATAGWAVFNDVGPAAFSAFTLSANEGVP